MDEMGGWRVGSDAGDDDRLINSKIKKTMTIKDTNKQVHIANQTQTHELHRKQSQNNKHTTTEKYETSEQHSKIRHTNNNIIIKHRIALIVNYTTSGAS